MALLPSFDLPEAAWTASSMPGNFLDSSQYGFDHNTSVPHPRKYTQEQIWAHDTTRKRLGNSSWKCNGFRDSTNLASNTASLDMSMIYYMGSANSGAGVMLDGDEEWFGLSYWFPTDFAGTPSWLTLREWIKGNGSTHPTYGPMTFSCPNPAKFEILFQLGHYTAGPQPSAAYNVRVALLGSGAPPSQPFTKGVWHDFYYYAKYQARSNGIFDLWHREEGGAWVKLYSNRNDGSALINAAPHPTFYYNDANGAPGEGGTPGARVNDLRAYRGTTAGDLNHDVIYWTDGHFRRQSQQEILNVFAAADNPSAPTITSFAPSSGTAGSTSVTITGTNFTGTTAVLFNGVPQPSFSIDLPTQITAVVPATATTGRIQVVNASGTGTSLTDFTVGATPPSTLPDPTAGHLRIGKADIGSSLSNLVPDFKRVIRRSLGPVSVTIDKAYAWIQGSTGTHRVVVYDDDGIAGAPGTLLGFSDPSSGLASASWVAFNFSTPVQATGDLIYIGLQEGTASNQIGIDTLANGMWFIADTYADGPSTTFGTGYSQSNIEFSLVCDYIVSGDTRAPLFVGATIALDVLDLLYDEALDPVSIPDQSSFIVTVNQQLRAIESVALSGQQVTLTMQVPVDREAIVTVAYTQPGSGALQDLFANKSASLTAQTVDNQTQPGITPRIINPAARVAIVRRVDPTDRRAGEGGGL